MCPEIIITKLCLDLKLWFELKEAPVELQRRNDWGGREKALRAISLQISRDERSLVKAWERMKWVGNSWLQSGAHQSSDYCVSWTWDKIRSVAKGWVRVRVMSSFHVNLSLSFPTPSAPQHPPPNTRGQRSHPTRDKTRWLETKSLFRQIKNSTSCHWYKAASVCAGLMQILCLCLSKRFGCCWRTSWSVLSNCCCCLSNWGRRRWVFCSAPHLSFNTG